MVTYSDGIGDTLMALPALRAVSQFFETPPAFIGSSISHAILQEEFPESSFFIRENLAFPLLGRHFDCWLSLDPGEDKTFSVSLLNALAPRWSVGWGPLHFHEIRSKSDLHFGDEVFELPKQICCSRHIEDYAHAPRIGELGEKFAHDIRRQLRPESKILVLHPETFAPNKNWSLKNFQRFMEQFLDLNSQFLALIIGLGQTHLDGGAFSERIISCEGVSLAATVGLIGEADLFIGIDSGMLHVADLYRIPSVGLFGPSAPSRWGCRFAQHRHVTASSMNVCDILEMDVTAAALALWREVSSAGHPKFQRTKAVNFDGTSS